MIRKALLLSFAYYAFALFVSGCCKCPKSRTIRFTDLSTSGNYYQVQPDSSILMFRDTGTNFSSKDYALTATLGYKFIASNCKHQSFRINEAYACSCAEPAARAQVAVVDLRVFTVNNFDLSHPAGTEITDRFGTPLIINGQYKGIGPLELRIPNDYFYGFTPYTSYDLFLSKRPDSGSLQQFRVVVKLQDSSSFAAVTPELQF